MAVADSEIFNRGGDSGVGGGGGGWRVKKF